MQNELGARLHVIHNEINSKQTESKNAGKRHADTPWIYFGDDDSILTANSIRNLLVCARNSDADIVGAVALYCRDNEQPSDALSRYQCSPAVETPESFADFRSLAIDFTRRPSRSMCVPVTHSCFLIRSEWAAGHCFDTQFSGNCYREETDFLLSCNRAGAKIWVCPEAHQINLPPELARGGARSSSRLKYECYSIINTWRLLRKHRDFFHTDIDSGRIELVMGKWMIGRLHSAIAKISRK